MPDHQKMKTSRWMLLQLEEDRADYALATEILARDEPTYTFDEVMRHSGMDKYYLKFRTKRLRKKHRLEFDAT